MAGKVMKLDLYNILGVSKDCSCEELRLAYKKLARIWHPDKCSGSSNSICMEQANTMFQQIQGAYSVLSDSNKRFLYDVGAYESDDEDANTGLSEILDEVVEMMSQIKPNENGPESMEEMQRLFDEIFSCDGKFGSGAFGGEKIFNGPDGSTSSDSSMSVIDPDLAKPDRLGSNSSQR